MQIFDLIVDQFQGQTIYLPTIGTQIEVRSVSRGPKECVCRISDGEQDIDIYPQTEFHIL